MKVGKPKSKRVPVRLRQKIQKSSAAKDRKRRKEAKKNPQWRSRLKKDPGIPNLFPYKAKLLAEIEENKRRKEEEAQKKREIAKAQRQGKAVDVVDQNGVGEDVDDDDEELQDDSDIPEEASDEDMSEPNDSSNPLAALLASAQARAGTYPSNEDDDAEDDEAEDEWNGIEDTNPTVVSKQLQNRGLPKEALADPIRAVSRLLDRMQHTNDGTQLLHDYYQLPPLATAGSDSTSRFLVEVARKRGRLGKGGVPNLHSAALMVLSDLNEQRLVLPGTAVKSTAATGKGDVQIVREMAQPFRIEGLWGDDTMNGALDADEKMAVEV